MRKIYYLLLVLFMGITTAAFAGESGPHTWDGKNKTLTLKRDTTLTFSYVAAEKGTLYIYSDNQGSSDNVPLTLQGGWYHDGAYDADSPLQDAGPYENGLGLYGWIKVFDGDEIRFTISTPKDAEGSQTRFTLKSAFFSQNAGGDSWENPVVLNQGVSTSIPVFPNGSQDVLGDLWISNATFCKFTAPSDGVASILTSEYLIYVLEEENIGSVENLFRSVAQDAATNDHEFIVRKGVDYIVVVPNVRPATLTFKMTDKVVGQSAKFPNEITEFPAVLDLKKGDNFYAFSHGLIGDKKMLDVAVAAGWNGTITYMEDPTENSTELAADEVTNSVATFSKNVDYRYLYGNTVIVNFNMTDKSSLAAAVSLTLREPAAGESFDTAIAANWGENAINGAAGDYWFAYTAEMDAVYSFATTGTLKHVNFTAGVEQLVADNVYRVDAGETIYVCVTTTTNEGNTFTVSGKEIVDGEYCDRPINFELGQDITIAGNGVDCYHSFFAEENGFATFTSTNWSVHFRGECGGRRLNPEETITESGDDVIYSYKLPVSEGQSYIVEVTAVSEDITISTGFESAVSGDVCATAVAINKLDEKINIAYAFETAKWYKYTATKAGFYTVKSKLGYSSNMTTKIGDCDAAETNAGSDNSEKNAYMGGYKKTRVYLEKGQTLYIYTKTGRSNDESQFSAEFYLSISYAEARPGEDAAIAIYARSYTDYTVMKNDADGYEQWYTFTIPAGKAISISMTATVKYISNCLNFLKENKASYLTKKSEFNDVYDYVQSDITDASGTVIGKRNDFEVIDTDRTFYIRVSTINAMYYPVVWKIEGDIEAGISVEEVTTEAAPVIYDLMGRRVENPGKGIYIIDGVKRIIK